MLTVSLCSAPNPAAALYTAAAAAESAPVYNDGGLAPAPGGAEAYVLRYRALATPLIETAAVAFLGPANGTVFLQWGPLLSYSFYGTFKFPAVYFINACFADHCALDVYFHFDVGGMQWQEAGDLQFVWDFSTGFWVFALSFQSPVQGRRLQLRHYE